MRPDYQLSQLDVLEAEAIHVMREVAAEFERPVLLFSGGKDSIVMLALAERAFRPARIPFPVMHIDTGHNFDDVLEFRDRRAAELGVRLIVASVQESIDSGRVFERDGILLVDHPYAGRSDSETPFEAMVRYRTVGDISCTGAVESTAATLSAVIAEIAATRVTERGQTRADDRVSEAAMEDRKR